MAHTDTGEIVARLLAGTAAGRDRRLLALVGAYLDGDRDRAGLLARDHLADHPGDIVAALVAELTTITEESS